MATDTPTQKGRQIAGEYHAGQVYYVQPGDLDNQLVRALSDTQATPTRVVKPANYYPDPDFERAMSKVRQYHPTVEDHSAPIIGDAAVTEPVKVTLGKVVTINHDPTTCHLTVSVSRPPHGFSRTGPTFWTNDTLSHPGVMRHVRAAVTGDVSVGFQYNIDLQSNFEGVQAEEGYWQWSAIVIDGRLVQTDEDRAVAQELADTLDCAVIVLETKRHSPPVYVPPNPESLTDLTENLPPERPSKSRKRTPNDQTRLV